VALALPARTASLKSRRLRWETFLRAFGFTFSTRRFVLPLAIFALRVEVAGLRFFSRP
jgi:hypothetical protein